jgi:hypothetical protein
MCIVMFRVAYVVSRPSIFANLLSISIRQLSAIEYTFAL